MSWIFIIAIGFICLICPVLIMLYLEWMPWYVIVAFCLWVVCCIGTITLSKGKEKKWYEIMAPSFVLTFVFTVLFLSAMDTDHYMFDENIVFWVVAPTLSLPVYYFIGTWLNDKWQAKKEAKRQEYNRIVDKQINDKVNEIRQWEQSVKNKAMITHLVDMLDCCGEDTSKLAGDPRISSIANSTAKLMFDIKKNGEEIKQLQKKKQ